MKFGFWLSFALLILSATHCSAWRRRRRKCIPVSCAWTAGSCSQSCGGGTHTYVKTRTEQCGGKCDQPPSIPCNTHPCPVDCSTSPWAFWGTCNTFCSHIGVKIRTRKVIEHPKHNGQACPLLRETKSCYNKFGGEKQKCKWKWSKCGKCQLFRKPKIFVNAKCGGECRLPPKRRCRLRWWKWLNCKRRQK